MRVTFETQLRLKAKKKNIFNLRKRDEREREARSFSLTMLKESDKASSRTESFAHSLEAVDLKFGCR